MIDVETAGRRPLRIEQSIEIEVPLRDVYSQWTRFDWNSDVAGRDVDWDVAILEAQAERRTAWRHAVGARCHGVVDFLPLHGRRTVVELQIHREPTSGLARLAGSLGVAAAAVARELRQGQARAVHGHSLNLFARNEPSGRAKRPGGSIRVSRGPNSSGLTLERKSTS